MLCVAVKNANPAVYMYMHLSMFTVAKNNMWSFKKLCNFDELI